MRGREIRRIEARAEGAAAEGRHGEAAVLYARAAREWADLALRWANAGLVLAGVSLVLLLVGVLTGASS